MHHIHFYLSLPHRVIDEEKTSRARMRKMEQRSFKTAATTPEESKDDLCRPSRWGVRKKNKKKTTLNGVIQQCSSSKVPPQRSLFIHQNHRTTIYEVCQQQIKTCPAARIQARVVLVPLYACVGALINDDTNSQ